MAAHPPRLEIRWGAGQCKAMLGLGSCSGVQRGAKYAQMALGASRKGSSVAATMAGDDRKCSREEEWATAFYRRGRAGEAVTQASSQGMGTTWASSVVTCGGVDVCGHAAWHWPMCPSLRHPPANSAHGAPFRTGGCFRVSVCMHTRTAAGPTRCTATSRVPGLVLNLVWLGLTQFFSQFCNRSDPRGK